jgi:nucleoside-diphosphate-sugar epimerase
MKQTILGAGGAIGIELAKALTPYTSDIRLVSRNPKKVNLNDELFPADLTWREDVFKAIEGSEIVYVTVGFAYHTKTWQKVWPPFIKNVIDACSQHNAKMVFFDNVYAIGGDHVNHITEESPISPCSKKGEVRAEVDTLILEAIKHKKLNAIIARSADFFSEVKATSMAMNLIYDNLIKGKKAQWLCDAKKVHSMSYTPDLAKGTAILGNTPDAYNQIWNLPTDAEKITGEGWVNLFAKELNASNNYQVLPNWLVKGLGLFIPIMKELPEMNYQFDRDYFFDSSKFNTYFSYTPTKNAIAVKQTVDKLRPKHASV